MKPSSPTYMRPGKTAPLGSELFEQAAGYMEGWLIESVIMYPEGAGPWGSERAAFEQAVKRLKHRRRRGWYHNDEDALWGFWVYARHVYKLPRGHTAQGKDARPGVALDAARLALSEALRNNYKLKPGEADVVTAIVEVAAAHLAVAELGYFREPVRGAEELEEAEGVTAEEAQALAAKEAEQAQALAADETAEARKVCEILANTTGLRAFPTDEPVGGIVMLAIQQARGDATINLASRVENHEFDPLPTMHLAFLAPVELDYKTHSAARIKRHRTKRKAEGLLPG